VRYTASSTVGSYSIDPATTGLFGSSLRNFAALYQETRCVSIQIQILPNLVVDNSSPPSAANSTMVVFGHAPLRGNTPASFSEVAQLSSAVAQTSGSTVAARFSLNRADLVGPLITKWVHFDGSPSTDTDSQGRIWTVATGSNSSTWVVNLLVKSTWEFKSPQPFDLFLSHAVKPSYEVPELKSEPLGYIVVEEKQPSDPPIPEPAPTSAKPQPIAAMASGCLGSGLVPCTLVGPSAGGPRLGAGYLPTTLPARKPA